MLNVPAGRTLRFAPALAAAAAIVAVSCLTRVFLAVLAFAYLALFLAVAEWLFWDEFFSRFNFIAVDYLIYTTEVLGNIRQSYPVGTILLALLLPAGAITAPLARRVWRWSGEPLGWGPALLALLAYSRFFFESVGYHRVLLSFPTRRSFEPAEAV